MPVSAHASLGEKRACVHLHSANKVVGGLKLCFQTCFSVYPLFMHTTSARSSKKLLTNASTFRTFLVNGHSFRNSVRFILTLSVGWGMVLNRHFIGPTIGKSRHRTCTKVDISVDKTECQLKRVYKAYRANPYASVFLRG